jgi:hypothetical protein
MTVTTTSAPQQQIAMPALDLRQYVGTAITSEGVKVSSDLKVTQRGAGANMSIDVAAGSCFIQDDHGAGGGMYGYTLSATQNVAVTAADATNPRVDRVVVAINDLALGDASNALSVKVIAGTPTGGASLANCTGAASVPGSALLLANVLVPAASTSVVTGNIDTTGASNNSPNVRPTITLVGGAARYTTAAWPPTSPVDQQLAILQVDATNGIEWLFVYNAGSASPYKWECIGGAPLTAFIGTNEILAGLGAWSNLATDGPSITVPRAGDYEAHGSANVFAGGAAGGYGRDQVGIAIGNTNATYTHAVNINQAANDYGNANPQGVFTGLSASAVLKLRYVVSVANHSFEQRYLDVRPIRIS